MMRSCVPSGADASNMVWPSPVRYSRSISYLPSSMDISVGQQRSGEAGAWSVSPRRRSGIKGGTGPLTSFTPALLGRCVLAGTRIDIRSGGDDRLTADAFGFDPVRQLLGIHAFAGLLERFMDQLAVNRLTLQQRAGDAFDDRPVLVDQVMRAGVGGAEDLVHLLLELAGGLLAEVLAAADLAAQEHRLIEIGRASWRDRRW